MAVFRNSNVMFTRTSFFGEGLYRETSGNRLTCVGPLPPDLVWLAISSRRPSSLSAHEPVETDHFIVAWDASVRQGPYLLRDVTPIDRP